MPQTLPLVMWYIIIFQDGINLWEAKTIRAFVLTIMLLAGDVCHHTQPTKTDVDARGEGNAIVGRHLSYAVTPGETIAIERGWMPSFGRPRAGRAVATSPFYGLTCQTQQHVDNAWGMACQNHLTCVSKICWPLMSAAAALCQSKGKNTEALFRRFLYEQCERCAGHQPFGTSLWWRTTWIQKASEIVH